MYTHAHVCARVRGAGDETAPRISTSVLFKLEVTLHKFMHLENSMLCVCYTAVYFVIIMEYEFC